MLSRNKKLSSRSPYANGKAGDKIAYKAMLFLKELG
jgi:hypothetical protein